MTGAELAYRVLEGEDPKKVFKRFSRDRSAQLGYASDFIAGYTGAALWSSTDDNGDPLDSEFDVDDIDQATFERMRDDCIKFFDEHYDAISGDLMQAGHDFWLTRNGHGAGFWDGDWPEEVGKLLTDASHAFGEFNLYIGDDGKIYGS